MKLYGLTYDTGLAGDKRFAYAVDEDPREAARLLEHVVEDLGVELAWDKVHVLGEVPSCTGRPSGA